MRGRHSLSHRFDLLVILASIKVHELVARVQRSGAHSGPIEATHPATSGTQSHTRLTVTLASI